MRWTSPSPFQEILIREWKVSRILSQKPTRSDGSTAGLVKFSIICIMSWIAGWYDVPHVIRVGYAELMSIFMSEYVLTGATVRRTSTAKPPESSPESVSSWGTTTTLLTREDSTSLNSSAMTKSVLSDRLGNRDDPTFPMEGMCTRGRG